MKLTKENLINWIDRPPSNSDLDIINGIVNKDKELERLNNIINEALNYIDDNTYYKDHKGHINIDDVYTILKGVDKE